jgi:hypothetical protein
VFYCVDACVA